MTRSSEKCPLYLRVVVEIIKFKASSRNFKEISTNALSYPMVLVVRMMKRMKKILLLRRFLKRSTILLRKD